MFHQSMPVFFWSVIIIEFGIAFALSTLLANSQAKD